MHAHMCTYSVVHLIVLKKKKKTHCKNHIKLKKIKCHTIIVNRKILEVIAGYRFKLEQRISRGEFWPNVNKLN